MNIEQIGADGIIISLCDKDMEKFDVTFESLSFSEEHSREVLKELMYFASVKTGIKFKDKKVFIEAMKYDHGCLLLLTVTEKAQKRKTYRIKGRSKNYTFVFDNVESFLRCIRALYKASGKKLKSSAYFCNGNYYLVIYSAILEKDLINIISEFSVLYRIGTLPTAILKEHGKILAFGNALEKIGNCLV